MKNNLPIAGSFKTFEEASQATLDYLHDRIGFKLWMTTRTSEPDWVVLQTCDHGYNVESGKVFQWADSFCSKMVLGQGPSVAPCSNEIPVYAKSQIARQVDIGAYIGVPITKSDGSLFGTLCAIDPEPQPEHIKKELPLVELCARLLGSILSSELDNIEINRQLAHLQEQALTDSLTGLLNRYGWEAIIEQEELRSKRYGSPICIAILDLDELKLTNDTNGHQAGDELLKKTAACLKDIFRESDVVARIGGDEFAVMAIECNRQVTNKLCRNILAALEKNQIKASVGIAQKKPSVTIIDTIGLADQAMYKMKQQHRNTPPQKK